MPAAWLKVENKESTGQEVEVTSRDIAKRPSRMVPGEYRHLHKKEPDCYLREAPSPVNPHHARAEQGQDIEGILPSHWKHQ